MMDDIDYRLQIAGAAEVHINVDEVDSDARRFYERRGCTCNDSVDSGRMLMYELGLVSRSPGAGG